MTPGTGLYSAPKYTQIEVVFGLANLSYLRMWYLITLTKEIPAFAEMTLCE
jgi:hypothetical protein